MIATTRHARIAASVVTLSVGVSDLSPTFLCSSSLRLFLIHSLISHWRISHWHILRFPVAEENERGETPNLESSGYDFRHPQDVRTERRWNINIATVYDPDFFGLSLAEADSLNWGDETQTTEENEILATSLVSLHRFHPFEVVTYDRYDKACKNCGVNRDTIHRSECWYTTDFSFFTPFVSFLLHSLISHCYIFRFSVVKQNVRGITPNFGSSRYDFRDPRDGQTERRWNINLVTIYHPVFVGLSMAAAEAHKEWPRQVSETKTRMEKKENEAKTPPYTIESMALSTPKWWFS